MDTVNLAGYDISTRGVVGDTELARSAVTSPGNQCFVACANPHSIAIAAGDPEFSHALKSADILLPDGIGVVLAARILRLGLGKRVAGNDFFLELTRTLERKGGARYFFLGSSPEVLEKISARLALEFSHIEICGTNSPPYVDDFSDVDNQAMVRAVNAAKPDVLWVGMTAPKQEKWIFKNKDVLRVPVLCGVGAVFDFYAGTVKRAPDWMCNIGLEWMPRLIREPKRMWRRNFISAPIFLNLVIREKIKRVLRDRSPAHSHSG